MRGRPPKPVQQRKAEGNPGKRPMPEPVVLEVPDDSLLEPPEHMLPEAQDAWRTIVPTLHKVGILDGVDRMALEAMCTQWARAVKAGRIVDKKGGLAKGSTGQWVEHPAVGSERSAHQMFLRFAEQYALTPVARTRLGLAELQRRSLKEELAQQVDLVPVE